MIPLANLCSVFPNQLYRVTYGTETRGGGAAAADRSVHKLEQALVKRLNAIRKSYRNAMADLEEVIQATHPLLFLFKSSEYSSEQEIRSIVHKDNYALASKVVFDDRDPKRAYVASKPGLISNKSIIYFGPKADHKFAIEAMGLRTRWI
ncbi:hypothetical protein [Aminiphilus circumscriptus]|uniref:hypothetical protein n=1 Tax=Aminiphilus circumscriptus TaxID=290732 RepID=UPI0012F7D019|nr:hypothetical protein [Aminiphilus circumscriptus]